MKSNYNRVSGIFLFLYVICFITVTLNGQSKPFGIGSGTWGIFGDIHRNQHSADFTRLPGIPNCCPQFKTGINEQFAGTIGLHIPLSHSFILRPSLTMWDGTLRYAEFTKGGIGGQIVDVQIGHSIESAIRSAGLEFLFAQHLFTTVQVSFGIRADYLYQSTYKQQEELLQPSGMGNWNNGSIIRNAYSGDIPDAHVFAIAPIIGLHWTFPANQAKTILLSPEFLATYNLIPAIQKYNWNVLALRLGCAISFLQSKAIDTVFHDSIIPVQQKITEQKSPPCEFTLHGMDSIGNVKGIDSIIIKETLINKIQPLLPFVFFDEDSHVIPSRYNTISDPQLFTISDMAEQSKLEIYSSILNIIGQRLRNKPNAKLNLTGCNAHYGKERGNRELSRMRAEAVQTYLHEIWGIALDRIKINARNLPVNASITRTGMEQDIEDSRQENRRVELFSDDPSILDPVHIHKANTLIEPQTIQIVFPEDSESSRDPRQLIVRMNDSVIVNKNIPSEVETMSIETSSLSAMLNNEEVSNYEIFIQGNTGKQECTSSLSIPMRKTMNIEKQQYDSSYSEYSLMLFPFNSSGLGAHNMAIIDTIKKTLVPGARIKIEGFTDRVGKSSYNKQLSFNRAKSVFNAMQLDTTMYSIEPDNDIFGSGEQDVHVLPEGRLYWRTVNIYVKNPTVKP